MLETYTTLIAALGRLDLAYLHLLEGPDRDLTGRLRKNWPRLQEVRDSWKLAVAERVAHRPTEQLHAETEGEATPTQAAGQVADRAVLLVPQRERGTDEAVLPEDYQRIMEVVRRADGPVMVKQVCAELAMSCAPAREEALRAYRAAVTARSTPAHDRGERRRTRVPDRSAHGLRTREDRAEVRELEQEEGWPALTRPRETIRPA